MRFQGADLGFRETIPNTSGGDAPKPFLSHGRSAIMEPVSGFSSCFPPRNLEGSLSPESGTGCIGSSTALSEQPPRGTDRRDRALRSPEGRPKGTHSQRPKRFPLRPRGHPGRDVPFAPAGSSRLRSCSEGPPPPTGPPLPSLRRFIRGRRAGSELRHQLSQVKWLRSSST